MSKLRRDGSIGCPANLPKLQSLRSHMTEKKQPHLPTNRMSKDEQTDRAAREIIRDETVAREEKTKRLKEARLQRDATYGVED